MLTFNKVEKTNCKNFYFVRFLSLFLYLFIHSFIYLFIHLFHYFFLFSFFLSFFFFLPVSLGITGKLYCVCEYWTYQTIALVMNFILTCCELQVSYDWCMKCPLLEIPFNTYDCMDSTVVLSLVRGNSRRFKHFVGNRVAGIMDQTHTPSPPQWSRHVPSTTNPAECVQSSIPTGINWLWTAIEWTILAVSVAIRLASSINFEI